MRVNLQCVCVFECGTHFCQIILGVYVKIETHFWSFSKLCVRRKMTSLALSLPLLPLSSLSGTS